LVQPDQRSCGATVLVVARLLTDPAYAPFVRSPWAFRAEVLAMHRRVTSPADVRGRLQLPWPRALGTPPWAVAHQLAGTTGVEHDVRLLRGRRDAAYDDIVAATTDRHPVPVYVGSRCLPRHVVLAVGTVGEGDRALRFYEPSRGRLVDVDRAAFLAGALDLAGWGTPWFSVLPRARRTPA
jgi:catechol 2,3-dioxygenase-like lactoylglutathione lyase family enzyme